MDLKFKESEEGEETGREFDELILTISYKDGDSDLGLGYNGEDVLYPYHRQNFFLEDGTGDTISFPVQPELIESAVGEDFLPVSIVKHGANSGTLVTTKTREKTNYGYLPEYDPMYSCLNYYDGIFYYAEEIVNEDDALNTITVDGKNFKQVKRLFYIRIMKMHITSLLNSTISTMASLLNLTGTIVKLTMADSLLLGIKKVVQFTTLTANSR